MNRRSAPAVAGAALSVTFVLASCARDVRPAGAQAPPPAAQPTAQAVPIVPAAGGPNPLMGDTAMLRHPGRPGTVLVRAGARPFITVRDYNAWLGTYPVNITSKDETEARRQALEQMVMFRCLAQRARQAGYAQRTGAAGRSLDDRSMVLAYIRDQISNGAGVTAEQIADYQRLHPERFPSESQSMPPELLTMAVKASIRGEQLEREIRDWMVETSIRYAPAGS